MRRKGLSVHPNLLIAFTIPCDNGIEQRQRVADIHAASGERDIIPVARGRRLQLGFKMPRRMEIHRAFIPLPIAHRRAQGNSSRMLRQIQQRHSRRVFVRHDPATNHRAVGFDRAIPTLHPVQPDAAAEEITRRTPDRALAVTFHLQDERTQRALRRRQLGKRHAQFQPPHRRRTGGQLERLFPAIGNFFFERKRFASRLRRREQSTVRFFNRRPR